MKTKDFANQFGMTVTEMCEMLDLSRQGLNEIVTGRSDKNSAKKRLALHELRDYAVDQKAKALRQADEDFKKRMELAEIFNKTTL